MSKGNVARIEAWKKANPEKAKAYKRKSALKRLYGITPEQYDELYLKQEGKCGICQRHQSEFTKRLSVDHDHQTGKIRGLLCDPCNTALGLLKDSMQTLENAKLYLSRTEKE